MFIDSADVIDALHECPDFDVNATDELGQTLLWYIPIDRDGEAFRCFKLLMKLGIDTHIRNKYEMSIYDHIALNYEMYRRNVAIGFDNGYTKQFQSILALLKAA